MRKFLIALSLLGLVCGAAMADGPRIDFGPGQYSPTFPLRDDVCQYGFTDMWVGSGYTLGFGQQLGISCAIGPTTITRVGFYCEFIPTPGTCNIVILDNGGVVSTTPCQPAVGTNEFAISPPAPITGTACIMLCGVGDFWAVTGEDTNAPISGLSFYSNSCECSYAFTDVDLTIWAVYGGIVPAEQTTWGAIQNMFR
jgi:hypothetical protein